MTTSIHHGDTPTPDRLCWKCFGEGRLLDAPSKKAGVDDYRCEKCGNVWMREKDDVDAALKYATIQGNKPPNA